MIFVTVGSQFPFERLIKIVDSLKGNGLISREIFAQIGDCQYKPRNLKYVNFLDKTSFDEYVQNASAIISHAGMGIISKSLEYEKPLLVMPRIAEKDEVVNDHQSAIAKKFEQLGHILVVYSQNKVLDKIKMLEAFVPAKRTVQSKKLIENVQQFLSEIYAKKQS